MKTDEKLWKVKTGFAQTVLERQPYQTNNENQGFDVIEEELRSLK